MLYNLTVTGKRRVCGGETAVCKRRRCKSATGASGRNSQAKGPCSANTLESSARNTDGASLFITGESLRLDYRGRTDNFVRSFFILIAKKPRLRTRRQGFMEIKPATAKRE